MSCQQCQIDYLHDKTGVLEQIVRRMLNVLTFSEQSDQVLKVNIESAKDLEAFRKRWPKKCGHAVLPPGPGTDIRRRSPDHPFGRSPDHPTTNDRTDALPYVMASPAAQTAERQLRDATVAVAANGRNDDEPPPVDWKANFQLGENTTDEPLPPGQAAEIMAKETTDEPPVNPATQTPEAPVKRGPGRPPGPRKLV